MPQEKVSPPDMVFTVNFVEAMQFNAYMAVTMTSLLSQAALC